MGGRRVTRQLPRHRRGQPFGHRRQRLAEQFPGIAALIERGPAGPRGDRADRPGDLGRDRDDPRGYADLRRRSAQPFAVALQYRRPRAVQRGARDLGRDVGVAVAVAADPGMKPDAGRDLHLTPEAGAGGGAETVEKLRHRVIDTVAEELQAPFDLIRQARPFQPQFAGHPEQVNLGFDVVQQVLPLPRGPALRFKRDKKAVDAAVNLKDRDALRFGRVGGQRRPDGQLPGHRGKTIGRRGGVHRGKGLGETALDRFGAALHFGLPPFAHGGILINDPA